jgi:hypothetical protein
MEDFNAEAAAQHGGEFGDVYLSDAPAAAGVRRDGGKEMRVGARSSRVVVAPPKAPGAGHELIGLLKIVEEYREELDKEDTEPITFADLKAAIERKMPE